VVVRRLAFAGLALVLCFGLGLGACAAVVASAVGGGSTATSSPTPSTSAAVGPLPALLSEPAVPSDWVSLEEHAAATCPGLGWSLLGAIGRLESDSGRSATAGVDSGENPAGAGPMQFEAVTFAEYAVVGPGGATPPSPYDPVDAVYTAAHMLCANGAGTARRRYDAVWDYDHTAVYVEVALVLAYSLAADPGLGTVPATAIGFAASKLGAPYLWGGTGQGGYDCSGLVQAAYRAARVSLPRVAQTQFDAGPLVAPLSSPEPGDLVFFGTSAHDVSHVGLYIGTGEMIDAPHTGAVVRVEGTPTAPGEPWGADVLVGETRPWEG
jgi:cell wall-associated NlpC family hydrolase